MNCPICGKRWKAAGAETFFIKKCIDCNLKLGIGSEDFSIEEMEEVR